MHPALYSTDEIRRIEREYARTHKTRPLMELAGHSVAKVALALLKARKSKDRNVLVLAGPGNNGGDAWVAADRLRQAKCRVTVLALGEAESADAAAKRAQQAYRKALGSPPQRWSERRRSPAHCDLILDGLFGIGLTRAPSGAYANVIRGVNALHRERDVPVLAIDVRAVSTR